LFFISAREELKFHTPRLEKLVTYNYLIVIVQEIVFEDTDSHKLQKEKLMLFKKI